MLRPRTSAEPPETGAAGAPNDSYRRLAEVCGQYLRRGSPVLVEGRLQMREWTTPQGVKRQRLEIRGEQVHFLEKMPAATGPDASASGKLNGAMTAQTPYGLSTLRLCET